jgi:8-oxo-dGTP pyrophosphatase MutT (NUDIX family)
MSTNEDRKKRKTRRPRDAATLVLYRHNSGLEGGLEVLMGERHGGHAFMPNHYVFPGGATSPGDSRVRLGSALGDDVEARLTRACTPARARALAAAAIRETFEETGLVLGCPDPNPGRPVPREWTHFFQTGMAPNVGALDYVARAITPPSRPRRFNARFFVAEAEALSGQIAGDGELLNIRWVPINEARRLEIPLITRVVLGHVEELVEHPPERSPDRPVPTYRMRYGRRHITDE